MCLAAKNPKTMQLQLLDNCPAKQNKQLRVFSQSNPSKQARTYWTKVHLLNFLFPFNLFKQKWGYYKHDQYPNVPGWYDAVKHVHSLKVGSVDQLNQQIDPDVEHVIRSNNRPTILVVVWTPLKNISQWEGLSHI